MKKDLRSLVVPALVLVVMHIIPLILLQPPWLIAICGALVLGRYFQNDKKPVSRWILMAIRIGVGFCIWQSYQSFLVDAAGGAFALLLASVKVYDLHKKNDFFFLAVYCLVTLMSDLLVQSNWLFAAVLFVNAFAVFVFLFAVQQGFWNWRAWREPVRVVSIAVLKTIPLMIAMYILFPRNNAEFGHGRNGLAKTGIVDSLQPGSVAELTASDELVFRAHFLKDNFKNKDQLYWRGAVLDISHGLNWSRRSTDVKKVDIAPKNEAPDVQVDLEPGSDRFIFGLENLNQVSLPRNSEYHLNARAGQIFELSEELRARDQYFLQAQSSAYEASAASDYLTVADKPSAELAKFLTRFRTKPGVKSDATVVQELLHFFGREGFKYSMKPPKVLDIDDFLFHTKTGFCEHYAGAMATLLRHLKIPARVVVGFQGGSQSYLTDYVSIRGHNAHAWVEYLDSVHQRWQRVDPTMELDFISPQQNITPAWVPAFLVPNYLRMRTFTDEWDARWNNFLLNSDFLRPRESLINAVAQNFWWIFLVVLLVLVIAYLVQRSQRPRISADEKIYLQLLSQLQKRNIEKTPQEGLLTLFEKVSLAQPQLADQLAPIFQALMQIRYGQMSLTPELAQVLFARLRDVAKRA